MTGNTPRISRRSFLRAAGAGAALSAGGLTITPGSAQSRVLAPAGRPRRPWWVRTVDEPTVEIDWDRVQRFDARNAIIWGIAKYVGAEEVARLDRVKAENERQRILDDVPGYTLKDQALYAAQRLYFLAPRQFLGPRTAPTPEERGVPRWTGTPEDAARIVRVAMRHCGAANVGFVELDERTRKLVYSHDPDGKELVFDDVEQAYEDEHRRVIPNRARWAIVYTVQMSGETLKRAPTATAAQTVLLSYGRAAHIQALTQEFLRGLGYQCLGESSFNALGIAPAFGVMAGLGELSRINRLITPEFGPMVRVHKLITDLPLAPDKPIDAGILRFCKTCKKCADACPAAAITLDDEPSWEAPGGWHSPGHLAYFEDGVKCFTYWREHAGTDCSICFAVCPFGKKDKAWIQDVARASVATVPALNGFLRSMDDAFGYGAKRDPEEWWRLDLPEYGVDTERTAREG